MSFRSGTIALALICAAACSVAAKPPTMADRSAEALSGPAWAPRYLNSESARQRFPTLAPRPGQPGLTTRVAPAARAFHNHVAAPIQRNARLMHPSLPRSRVVPASVEVSNEGGADSVTMHLDDVDVRQVLELLSRTYGKSILVAPEVTGKVTVNFEKVPIDEALAAILKLCNLVSQREGQLLYVYSQVAMPQANLQVKVFPLDYSSAEEMLPTIEGMVTLAGKAFSRVIKEDDHSRYREAIIVSDSPESIARIAAYVAQSDQPPLQVMIEAHVLKIDLSDDLQHGVNFKQAMNNVGTLEFEATGFANPLASPAVFARVNSSQVEGLIQFLKVTTDAKTLASPRVMVVNGQKARIQVGNQLGYKVVTVTETAAVEEVKFLEVGIVLEVTPRISRDGRVLMRVKPKVSDGEINATTLLPEEQTSELESDVLLADGQGVVIGGLIQERNNDIQQKLPVLGDLYVVGRLFQKRQVIKERSEIVVTLVPRIIRAGDFATETDVSNAERSQIRLFNGPLHPNYRPWEPQLMDAVHNPYQRVHGLGCGLYRNAPCDCQPSKAPQHLPQGAPQQPTLAPMTVHD